MFCGLGEEQSTRFSKKKTREKKTKINKQTKKRKKPHRGQ